VPSGRAIALASWTPDGFIGDLLRVVTRCRLAAGGPIAVDATYLEAIAVRA
jgi:hypothetical protein